MSEVSSQTETPTYRQSLKVQLHEPIKVGSDAQMDSDDESNDDSEESLNEKVGNEKSPTIPYLGQTEAENSKVINPKSSYQPVLIQKKPKMEDQLRESITSPEKRGRALDSKDMRLLALSNEMRRGLLR